MGSLELLKLAKRKIVDTSAKKRRRLPYVVDLHRTEPFCSADWRQLNEQCRRITNGQEFWVGQVLRDGQWRYVAHMAAAHQADALKDWLWRERFSARRIPKFGPTKEEAEAFEREIIAWGIRTGALRRVVQAFRHAYREGQSLHKCRTLSQQAMRPYLPPNMEYFDGSRVMVSWAEREHYHWFNGYRPWAKEAFRPPDWYPPDDAYAHSEE